ncbi:hypothetical protein OJ570_000333 [Escherichia coli]|nr:hypothetical protein [Escherichia coli]
MKLHETAQNEILRLTNEKNGLSLTFDDVEFARVLSSPETTSILFKGKDGSRYYKSVFVSMVKRDLTKAFLGIPVKIIIEEDTQLREIMQAVADRYGVAFDLATDFLQEQLNKTTTTSTTGRQSVRVAADEGSLVWAGDLELTVENRKYDLLSLIRHLDLTGLKYLRDDRTKGDVELLIAGIDPDRFAGLANLQQGEVIYPALAHRIADAIRRENAPEDIGLPTLRGLFENATVAKVERTDIGDAYSVPINTNDHYQGTAVFHLNNGNPKGAPTYRYAKGTRNLWQPMYWIINGQSTENFAVVSEDMVLNAYMRCHTANGLVGIEWRTTDTLDHGCVAYAPMTSLFGLIFKAKITFTGDQRNFADTENPPVLTVVHKDDSRQYISLTRYATDVSKDGTSATVTIDFNDAMAGFYADEPIELESVTSLMFSMSSRHYKEGATETTYLETPIDLGLTIEILPIDGVYQEMTVNRHRCTPHELRAITAYDDHYNITPERVFENLVYAGYQDELVHYVGMSHFYDTVWTPSAGKLLVNTTDVLNPPCIAWHEAFAAYAAKHHFSVTISLSYELMSTACPFEWAQQDWEGNIAATGYTPPSWLLSPCNQHAMAWLGDVLTAFADIIYPHVQDICVQVGEPWWWINTKNNKPCIYDYQTKLAFNTRYPNKYAADIGDINNPLSGGDYDLYVEFCNDQLGYACWNLVNRVKSKYTQIKTGILPFLPTIMSNDFTEKLNLPKAWYNPEKFDRFYSECYDWIIETHVTKAEQAITIPRDTLGFPVSQIHYYLGFVPGVDLAPLYGFDVKTPYKRELWKRIMGNHANNLDMFEGLTQYIWAYPQFIGDSIVPGQVPEEFYFLGKRYDIIRTDVPFDFTPDA